MILKPIQIVLDSSGNQIDLNYRPIRSHTNYRHIIQIVAPNVVTEACDVTVSTYGKEIISETIRTRLAVDSDGNYLKGSDVVSSDQVFYVAVSNYNVWEVELVGTVASVLQKINTSKISIVVSFSMPVVDSRALANVGSFGLIGDLPVIAAETVGDYRICDCLAYTSSLIATDFKYRDIAIYDGSTWIKGHVFRMIQTCPMIQLSVDPSLALLYNEVDDDNAIILIGDVARIDGIVSDVQTKVDNVLVDNLNLNIDINALEAADIILQGADIIHDGRLDNAEAELIRLENDKSDITYVDTQDDIIKGRVSTLETFKNTTVPATYETKTNATLKLAEAKTYTDDQIGLKVTDKLGVANGIATIGADGYIPSSQVANSFDDVLEFATYAALTAYATPTTGKLYVVVADEESNDNHSTYRYTGSIYIRVSDEMSASEIKALYESNADTNVLTDTLKTNYDTAYSHSQVADGTNPHGTTFANIESKPTDISGYGITDAYTKTEVDTNHYTSAEVDVLLSGLEPSLGLQSTLLTPTDLLDTDSILTSLFTGKSFIVLVATNLDTYEVDTDTLTIASIVVGKKFYFFDNENINFEIGTTNSTFSSTTNVSLKINAFASTDAVNASQVSYNNAASELDATQVQAAIDEVKILVDGKAPTVHTHVEADITDLQAYLTEYTETDPVFTAWDKSTGISISASQVTDLNSDNVTEGTTNLYYTDTRVSANEDVVANSAKVSFDSTSSSKLAGIEAGAEVNVVDSVNGKTGVVSLALADLSDIAVDTPALGQGIIYNGVEWTNGSIQTIGAGKSITLFPEDTPSDISGYSVLSPIPLGLPEETDSVTLTNVNTDYLIDTYATAVLGRTSIQAGIWNFKNFTKVNGTAGTTILKILVYKRNTAGTETLLFEVASADIQSTTTTQRDVVTTQTEFAILATDRLVVKYYGRATTAGIIISLVHSGTVYTTRIDTPLQTLHNDLAGLQGGASNDYYHLTSAEKTLATSEFTASSDGLVPTPAEVNATKFLRADGTWVVPTDTNTTYENFTASVAGLVPTPAETNATKFLRADGTWVVPTDTNDTYSAFTGATSSADGAAGLVTKPLTGTDDDLKFLKGDGTWAVPTDTNTTYENFTASVSGLVPTPAETNATKFLRADGTWVVPTDTDTTYSAFTGATSSVDGAAGLVTKPLTGTDDDLKFLKGDGTWATPAGGAASLDDLTDVTITTPSDNQFLRHNGTVFVNESVTILSLGNYTSSLPTTGWTGASAPFSYGATVSGILSTDVIDVDLDLSSSTYSDIADIEADYSNVYRVVTSTDTVTFYASAVPTIAVPLKIKVVR